MCNNNIRTLLKQCFVTAGVTINYMSHGLVMGFTSVLLPALRESTEIQVEESTASWIASIFGISFILGTLPVPFVIGRFGRKPANAFSAAIMTTGWISIAFSTSAASLLLGRFFQGYSMGFLAIMGSILIGEYTSPRNRGAFLATISLFIMIGVFMSHGLGTILPWKTISLIFAAISFLNLLMILYSPESPSFLATRGRFDKCRKVYHWLRGSDENEELDKILKAAMITKRNSDNNQSRNILKRIERSLANIKTTFSKKEVYKPVIIGMHIYAMNLWAGGILLDAYAKDIINVVVGKGISYPLVIVSLDIQRTISLIIAVYTVKKLRRKLVLGLTMPINLLGSASIALFVYLKVNNILTSDHPLVGIVLLHIQSFATAIGCMTISIIIPGEIFPMKHRGVCGMIGILFFSINETVNLKSAPHLFMSVGVHGTYAIHMCLVLYCFVVTWIMLPETKDKTLLDIEEEFRGKPLISEDLLVKSDEKLENDKTIRQDHDKHTEQNSDYDDTV